MSTKNYHSISRIIAALVIVILTITFTPVTQVFADSSGPNFPKIGTDDSSVGTIPWLFPALINANDGLYVTAVIGTNDRTHYLQGADFGFNIPTDATINGIQVIIGRYSSNSSSIRDFNVRLVKGGSVVGENRAKQTYWPTSEIWESYGSVTDLWGTTWTPADINASNFGVALSVTNLNSSIRTANVDYMRITITYTPAGSSTVVNCSPNPVAVRTSTSCTATVTRVMGSNTPGGTVSFEHNGSGSFTPSSSCTLAGSAGTATCSVTYTSTTVGTGGHSISANYSGDSNFNSSSGSTLITINRIALTVTGITASNKVYDGLTTSTLDVSSTGLVGVISPDVVNLNTTGVKGTFTDKNVGTGKTINITGLSLGGTSAGNYILTQPSTTADITPKNLTVTGITSYSKEYDGLTNAALNTTGAVLAGVISPDVVSINSSSATGIFIDKNAGTDKTVSVTGLTLEGANAGNYAVTQPSTTGNITPKELSVTGFSAISREYTGLQSVVVDFNSTVLVGVESLDVVNLNTVGAAGLFNDKNVGLGKPVTISGLTLEGVDAGNYSLAQPVITGDITTKPLTVAAIGINKIYDGTPNATVGLEDDRIMGDVLNTSYATAAFNDSDVGTAKQINVNGISISGLDAGNYSVNTTTTAIADITPKELTINATGVNKTYDGTTVATVTLSDNRISDDILTTSYTSAVYFSKDVGVAKPISTNGISITGEDSENYSFNTTATTFADITLKELTVNATGVNKTYDGTPDAAVSLSDDRVSGDILTTSYTSAAFADKDVGTTKPIIVSGISISGADSGNYSVNPSAETNADINAKPLSVMGVTASSKIYDGMTTAMVDFSSSELEGVVSPDEVILNTENGVGSFADKNIGVGKVVTILGLALDGTHAGNYTLIQPSPIATITPRELHVAAIGENKVYDGTTTAIVVLSDNRIPGDVLDANYSSATFTDRNVGTANPINVFGISISGIDAGNYAVNVSAATTADITAKTLTVTGISAVNKVYDRLTSTTLDVSGANLEGVELPDVVTLDTAGAVGTFADKAVGIGKTVTIEGLTLEGADSGNYLLAQASTYGDITAKSLTVSADGVNKMYDGTATAFVILLDNRIAGDAFTCSYASALFDDKEIGTAKTVTVSGISISGPDAENYTVNQTATTTADILPATHVSKIYLGVIFK